MKKKQYNKWMYYVMLMFSFATNVSPAITCAAIILGSILVVTYRLRERDWPDFDIGLMRWLGGYFCLWMILSFMSIEPENSIQDVFATFYRIFPLFFVMVMLKNKEQLNGVIIAFSISVLITDIVAVWQWLSPVSGFARASGLSNSATFLGSHMLMAIPVLLWGLKVCDLSNRLKCFLKVDIVLSGIALFASGTRGAWLAFYVMFMAYLFTRNYVIWKKFFLFGVTVLTIVSFVAVVPSFKNRLVSIGDLQYQSNSERLLMWQSAINILVDYPLTGIGAGEFGLVYNSMYISPLAKERPYTENPRSGHGHPHNNILKRFAEGGILGGVAFITLNAYLFRRLLKQYWGSGNGQYSFALMGILILVGFHLEGMTDTNIISVPVMREFWFLLGIALVADKVVEKKIS